jgi:cobalt/nickel transport system permease protein
MILAEQHAYRNRWRSVSADAKSAFASLAFVAAFVAHPPVVALALAVALAAVTVLGAGVPLRAYAKVASAPWSFVALSAVTLAVSVRLGSGPLPVSLAVEPAQVARAAAVVARSLAALSAMLFLALTTPMTDLIALLRRMHVPATLIEIMTLSYRSLSVLSDAIHDMTLAQSARLGYSSFANTVRSLGTAVALLAVETWRRSIVMYQASVARAGGGELLFLESPRTGVAGELALAVLSGAILIAGVVAVSGGVR